MANNADQATKFSISDTKHYVPVVTLSIQDNVKLLLLILIPINWKKYQSKKSREVTN